MFKNTKEEVSQEVVNSNNIIGKGSTFKGNVQTYGNIRVEGRIVGDITSKSKVAIGPSAIIEGNVLAQVAEVEGEVKGALEVTELLILKPSCKIHGDIIANKLIVESGARFDGQCKMGHQSSRKIEIDAEQTETDKPVQKLKEAI